MPFLAVPYLAEAMRPSSPDPAVDAALAVLEVAARGRPPALPLLEQARQVDEPLLRASAERLLAALGG